MPYEVSKQEDVASALDVFKEWGIYLMNFDPLGLKSEVNLLKLFVGPG